MNKATSRDGTPIAYRRDGRGPAAILISGGLDDGTQNLPLAGELADRFTVYTYAKRGTGDSGDTLPYALEHEIEDLEALIAEAGGSACVFGVSAGGALALEAAAAGAAIARLAVYEVPYDTADDAPQRQRQYFQRLESLLAQDRRGDALAVFMRTAGASEDDVAGARHSPMWPGLESIAHTLLRGCGAFGPPPRARLASITRPALVITGGAPDPHTRGLGPDFFERAADTIAAAMPHAERLVLPGQAHAPDAKALAPVLAQFFQG